MARRLLVFGLLAALSQAGTGCCGVRQCIANRWHYFHGGCGGCCTPAFKVPPPVGPVAVGPAPVMYGPPPSAGCPSCYGPTDPGPVAFAGPLPGPVGGPVVGGPVYGAPPVGPVISSPMPLLNGATIEPPGANLPAPMPLKGPN